MPVSLYARGALYKLNLIFKPRPTSSCVTEELCETRSGRRDIAEENALVDIKSTTSTVPPAEDGTDDAVKADVSTESDATTAIKSSFSERRLLPPSPKSPKCPPDSHTMDRHVADTRLMLDHASKYASPPPSPFIVHHLSLFLHSSKTLATHSPKAHETTHQFQLRLK